MAEALGTILKGYLETWRPNPEGFLFINRNGKPQVATKAVEYGRWPIPYKLKIEAPACTRFGIAREFVDARGSEYDGHENANATFGCANHFGNLYISSVILGVMQWTKWAKFCARRGRGFAARTL